uniref:Secreted protein n=1 Tax=Steinernema glaseri TaxID=37863 RepID=A0A1I7YRV6_9BILA
MIRGFILAVLSGSMLCQSEFSSTTNDGVADIFETSTTMEHVFEEKTMMRLLASSTNSPLVELLEVIRSSVTPQAGSTTEEESVANSTVFDVTTTALPTVGRLDLQPSLADILRKVFARKEAISF